MPRLVAAHLWELLRDDVEAVINALAAKRTKRPVANEELVKALRGPFPTMVDAWSSARRS